MDLRKKFSLVEEQAKQSLKPAVVTDINTEITELVNWRKSFKFNSEWLKESILLAFDDQFKKRRRQFLLEGITDADMNEVYRCKQNIILCLKKSAPIIHSFQAKTILVLSQEKERFYFAIYKIIPELMKSHSLERSNKSRQEFTKNMSQEGLHFQFIDQIVKGKGAETCFFTGVKIDVSVTPISTQPEKQNNQKNHSYEKFQEL
jgi:hypothetical protein